MLPVIRFWVLLLTVTVGCTRQPNRVIPADLQPQQQRSLVQSQGQEATLPDGNLSPDAILAFLNAERRAEGANLWQRLGIEDWGYDKAEKFEFDLGNEEKLLVIRIGKAIDRHFRYLFFRLTETNEWRFVSYHDEVEQKYGPPQQRIETAGSLVWFVVKRLGASGTGLSWYSQVWLNISEKEATIDLILPIACETYSPGEPTICETWELAEKNSLNGKYIFRFEGHFSWRGGDEEFFAKRGSWVYVWNPGKNALEFDSKRSTVSERGWDKYSVKGDAGFNRSLKLYYAELLQVARDGNQDQKHWLKNYLERSKENSSYRIRLLQAVNKSSE
jgi:hypothetical protein